MAPWPLIGWHIFDFCSEIAERNSTKLNKKQDLNVVYLVCAFLANPKTWWLPGLWLADTFSTSPLKPLSRSQRYLTGNKFSTSSTKFVFFRANRKTRRPPWPLICLHTFDFSWETTKQNSKKLNRMQDINALYQCCVFRPIGKTRWPPCRLMGWHIFSFSS